jgi:DNA-binding GntR family transcriptional regulator
MSTPKQLKPIGRVTSSLADEAYQRIAEAMLNGTLSPGARLVMDQLAGQLDISRTPVRDALLRLEREGLIVPSGRRGYVVSPISAHDVEWLYEAREAIEGFAARRVAERGPAAIALVESVVDSAELAKDSRGAGARDAFEANLRVHRSVVEATANPTLLTMFDDVWQRARGMATFADYMGHAPEAVGIREDHLPLVEALRAGPDEAFAAMREHIRQGRTAHLGE